MEMPYSKISLEHKPVINELDLTVVNPVIDMLPFQAQVKIASTGIEKNEWFPYGNLEKKRCALCLGFMIIQ